MAVIITRPVVLGKGAFRAAPDAKTGVLLDAAGYLLRYTGVPCNLNKEPRTSATVVGAVAKHFGVPKDRVKQLIAETDKSSTNDARVGLLEKFLGETEGFVLAPDPSPRASKGAK